MLPESGIFPGEIVEDPPEVYCLYKKCEKWGLYWAGGVADQPHLLMTEFSVCTSAENEFESVILPQLQKLARPPE